MTEQLSARRDTVNPEKRRYVRVANAEERLIACLFHNNDLAQSLNRRVPPEKFVTAFNRRLYQSLLGKIINEETVTSPQITDFSAGMYARTKWDALRRLCRKTPASPPKTRKNTCRSF